MSASLTVVMRTPVTDVTALTANWDMPGCELGRDVAVSGSPRWLYPETGDSRRLQRVLSASSPAEPVRPVRPAGPAGPIPRKSVTGMPVVGMVGGGQLARMTAQAAIGLGARFRVLAG